ncbi:PREDICTED: kinetochore protein Nuf2 [Gavialis gangeticus]|uniref:kinetochore protein Nuf2 n=1 Tax=Gavialis gangeticus TaxID=94835 RepID=UPI00092F0A2F|nr:PREDICTED: kinetochore protein Nuf2 [Gavialis gangeticus]XP_019357428.1 PREDICTED: kinetochore protein Nuf2 [Gavialis gangeticus]
MDLTFPRYGPNDLLTHLRNQVLAGAEAKNLVKSDLFPSPKPEVLHMIFMRVLQNVYGIRLEHFYMMPVTVEIIYPQILEGFLPVCNLYIHMGRFLPICRVNDFQIADIINPKAKRTARFLSAILNFIHFQGSCRNAYLELQWTYKSTMEKIQQLQTANQQAAMKLEKLDTIPAEQQAEFKQLSDDIQELRQLLNTEYCRKTTALQEVTSQKKSEVSERTRSLNELKVTIATLKEEQEQLKSQIVESPEELKNYKEHMKETVQKLKKAKQDIIEKYESYRDLVEILPSCQLEVQLYQKRMQSQGENVDRMASILSEVRNLEDQIECAQRELKNAKTDEMSLKRLVTAKHEKLSTTGIRIKKKHEDVEQYKRTVFEHCNRVQEKRGAVYEKVTAIHKEIKQIRSKVQQLNENTENEKMKAQEIYLNLRAGLEKYHESLAKIAENYATSRDAKIAELKRGLLSVQTSLTSS